MKYELCKTCTHVWHGLECEVTMTKLTEDFRPITATCGCPSQFKDTTEER